MNASDLKHGQAYDCTMDGNLGKEKTCIIPLSINASASQRYVLIDARKLAKENPALLQRLVAMTFDEIDGEDFQGSPDREWSSYIWIFDIDEHGELYYEQYDCYLQAFAESDLGVCATSSESRPT